MASIKKRPDGRWRARWREYPGGPELSRHFARKTDAEHYLDGIRGQLVEGRYVDPSLGRQTFGSFADEWAASQDWKATTRQSWPPVRARLLPVLGDMPLGAIDRLKLETLRRSLAERYARNTVTQTMAYAGMVMRAAYASGRIGRDPTAGLRAPKARADEPDGQVTPEQVPTRAEARAILEGARPKYRAAIALGLAGLRIGEVLGMSVDRLDLPARKVTVDRQMQRIGNELTITTPKAEKNRTIVVPSVAIVELRRHLRDHHGDGFLFQGRAGGLLRRDTFYRFGWKPALAGAGLAPDRFVFHSLRHWCASSLLAEGTPLTAVAGHLGDTVETVSRTYVHWLRDDRDVPGAVLERLLAPNAEQEAPAAAD